MSPDKMKKIMDEAFKPNEQNKPGMILDTQQYNSWGSKTFKLSALLSGIYRCQWFSSDARQFQKSLENLLIRYRRNGYKSQILIKGMENYIAHKERQKTIVTILRNEIKKIKIREDTWV